MPVLELAGGSASGWTLSLVLLCPHELLEGGCYVLRVILILSVKRHRHAGPELCDAPQGARANREMVPMSSQPEPRLETNIELAPDGTVPQAPGGRRRALESIRTSLQSCYPESPIPQRPRGRGNSACPLRPAYITTTRSPNSRAIALNGEFDAISRSTLRKPPFSALPLVALDPTDLFRVADINDRGAGVPNPPRHPGP